MSWTDERVEQLRKLWNEGLSATQIAAELGASISRNAVIGKIHRLGIQERVKAAIAPRVRIPAATSRRLVASAPKPAVARQPSLKPIAPAFEEIEPLIVLPTCERVTLIELRESMCKWPIGDPSTPEFRFCGGRAPGGSPYCGYHAQVAYQPMQDRRRARDGERAAKKAVKAR